MDGKSMKLIRGQIERSKPSISSIPCAPESPNELASSRTTKLQCQQCNLGTEIWALILKFLHRTIGALCPGRAAWLHGGRGQHVLRMGCPPGKVPVETTNSSNFTLL